MGTIFRIARHHSGHHFLARFWAKLARTCASCPRCRQRPQFRLVRHVDRRRRRQRLNRRCLVVYRAGNWKETIEAMETSIDVFFDGDAFERFFLAMAEGRLDNKQKGVVSVWQ